MIVYKTGNLFASPKGSVLVHATNAMGTWGKGLALQMAQHFPLAYGHYKRLCNASLPKKAGWAVILPEEGGYRVGCLCTSVGYGDHKDDIWTILDNTEKALEYFVYLLKPEDRVFSNRFNSGLFQVDWNLTQEVLERVIGNRLWTVMDCNT